MRISALQASVAHIAVAATKATASFRHLDAKQLDRGLE
jgi:hypothetical protein